MAYATLDDLQKRWRALNPSEIDQASTLLDDAAVYLQSEFARNGKEINEKDELLMSALRIVSCSLVRRIMKSDAPEGVSQMGITAGPFNQQRTYVNPSGDMYLTAREYGILGISQKRSGIAQIGAARRAVDDV